MHSFLKLIPTTSQGDYAKILIKFYDMEIYLKNVDNYDIFLKIN